jgi:phosphate:Na+ symporter
LRDGLPESIETSSLHLDVMRDLKRIHSHICSVAYPVLEAAGALQPDLQRGMENQSTAEDSVVAKGRAEPRPS